MQHVLMCSGPLKQADVLKEHKVKQSTTTDVTKFRRLCDLSDGMCSRQACKGKEPKRALTENIQTYDLLPELLKQ